MYLTVQYLERLESECARFHSAHNQMGDDMESVSDLKDKYLKFLGIIAVSIYISIQAALIQYCLSILLVHQLTGPY